MHEFLAGHDAASAPLLQALQRAVQSWDGGLLEWLPVGIYTCDRDGCLVQFNRRAAELWGRAPAVGDPQYKFCGAYKAYRPDGEPLTLAQAPMLEVLRTGASVRGRELVIERPDGSRVTVLANLDPLLDENGAVIGGVNCFQDITEQKRAEARLGASEAALRSLIEALPAAIYTTDASGKVTFFNQAAADLAGREPVLGSDEWCVTWRLYRPDGTPLPHEECPMAVALKEDRPVRDVEALAERPDGTLVPFIPYPTPLHDEQGRLVGAVNMLVDISERRQAESRQRVLLDELNHRVKNNMQMLHALLRTAAREAGDGIEAERVLTDACRRVGAMAAAQNALYDGGPSSFDARGFLDSVCNSSRQALGDGIEVIVEAASGRIANDKAMPLALIANELVSNAAKHGIDGAGSGAIRVGLTQRDGEGVLYVADDGPGFALHRPARRSSGLNLVTGLARQIGGAFSVETTDATRCIVKFKDASPQVER